MYLEDEKTDKIGWVRVSYLLEFLIGYLGGIICLVGLIIENTPLC